MIPDWYVAFGLVLMFFAGIYFGRFFKLRQRINF